MSICYLKDGKFTIGQISTSFDDLFTRDFYNYSDSMADKCFTGHIYDNILFVNMIQNKMAIEYYLKINNVSRIVITEENQELYNYTIDAANSIGIPIETKAVKKKPILSRYYLEIDVATVYLFVKQLHNKYTVREISYDKDFAVIRTPSAKGKIRENENREIFYEDKVGIGSLYTFFSIEMRKECLISANKEAKKELHELKKQLEEIGLLYSMQAILGFFTRRLLAAKFYQSLIRKLFSLPWKGKFISGNNLDLYALAEEEEAHNAHINTVCIPHGIEYGFKLPHCFTGDVFYTYSQYTAEYLNELYGVSKFVFDKELIDGIFRINSINNHNHRIVYFSEPREPEVNLIIIRELLQCLGENRLYIKHHPKDNLKDYSEFNGKVEVIQQLNEAIQGNICLSRKSTTLLEGVYNDSKCGAILINEKDRTKFYGFPSLQDDGIKVFESPSDAAEWAISTLSKW